MCEHSDVTFVTIFAFSSVKFQNVRKYACVIDLTNLIYVNTKQSLNCHLDSCKWDWPDVTIWFKSFDLNQMGWCYPSPPSLFQMVLPLPPPATNWAPVCLLDLAASFQFWRFANSWSCAQCHRRDYNYLQSQTRQHIMKSTGPASAIS